MWIDGSWDVDVLFSTFHRSAVAHVCRAVFTKLWCGKFPRDSRKNLFTSAEAASEEVNR